MCGGDGDGGDGGGFGAEDSRAEGDGRPCVSGEEGDFFLGPTAFGTDGERQLLVVGCWLLVARRSINPGLETVRGTEFNLPHAG